MSTLREPHLILVYDKSGHEVRDFGDPEQISDREDLNRYLNSDTSLAMQKEIFTMRLLSPPNQRCAVFDRFGFYDGPND